MMAVPHQSGAPLEDHLRNLILNNTEAVSPPGQVDLGSNSGSTSTMQVSDGQPTPLSAPSKSRKRPNQAQRRQMSSRMTIDIDPRATASQSAKPYNNQAGFQRGRDSNFHQSHPNQQQSSFHNSQGHTPSGSRSGPQSSQHPQQNRGFGAATTPLSTPAHHQQNWRSQQQSQHGPHSRGVNVMQADSFGGRPPRNTHGTLYNPDGHRQYQVRPEELAAQSGLLEHLCMSVVQGAEIDHSEILEKDNFRGHVELICRAVVSDYEVNTNQTQDFQPYSVRLACFGSLASGFATKAADMDLGLVSPNSKIPPDAPESPIPRLIERALLDAGFGARLLTRTRVPIIKLCEKPSPQLHSALLEERRKWEQGLTDDEANTAEESTVNAPSHEQVAKQQSETLPAETAMSATEAPADMDIMPKKDKEAVHRQLLASLKQSHNQTLLAYHNQAKKILRQLGGHDVTHSNVGVFTAKEFQLLDKVSNAFVEGLHDAALRDRLMLHPSFASKGELSNWRTLHGVCNMAEGEKLVMLWENRVIHESDPRSEQSHARTVHWWTEFHRTRYFGLDPLSFNKEMFLVLEKLRKIPSVQLMQLQQEPYESAADYFGRASKIMAQLSTAPHPSSELPPPTIRYYISGIDDQEIRETCETFVRNAGTMDLKDVARRHRSLHLANDYARAVEKGGLYSEDDIPLIKEYIQFLRSDLIQTPSVLGYEYRLPVGDSLSHVYRRILELPSPGQLAPNQPKDRYHDRLEFPQSGIGVQCDINFSADLALQNSHLLRCYAATDPRVRPMVLFVKHWAKARDINTPYRGTLSSYGYVLMVIHYLVNVVQPFVCPNLQILAPEDPQLPPGELEGITTCKGRNVRFWRNENEIQRLSQEGVLNANRDPIGYLLRGFFEYYAQNNMMSTIQKRGFDWGRDVISLRTPGGLMSKQEKNWVQAKTVMQTQMGAPPTPTASETQVSLKPVDAITPGPSADGNQSGEQKISSDRQAKSDLANKPQEVKEVRHRYLFAIEDPFEHDHNVARTVTHHGIVSIRDEFRRAWRIIRSGGKTAQQEDLLENVKMHAQNVEKKQFADLLSEIHGGAIKP
jgi:terminal uridylyltransferase